MALQQIVVSDLSGAVLADAERTRLIVEHPDFPVALELDVSSEEAARLQDTSLRLVNFMIHAPNMPPRRARVETRTLDKLFEGVDFDRVLEGARKSDVAAKATSSKAAATARPDYGDPQNAGVLHRGRVTEREAGWVRANLERANANRARSGQAQIDPSSDADKRRYGFE